MGRDLEDVLPQERLPAGEDDDGLGPPGQVGQEVQGLGRVHLAGVDLVPGTGPAVDAGQVAAPGNLPGQDPQGRRPLARSGRVVPPRVARMAGHQPTILAASTAK